MGQWPQSAGVRWPGTNMTGITFQGAQSIRSGQNIGTTMTSPGQNIGDGPTAGGYSIFVNLAPFHKTA